MREKLAANTILYKPKIILDNPAHTQSPKQSVRKPLIYGRAAEKIQLACISCSYQSHTRILWVSRIQQHTLSGTLLHKRHHVTKAIWGVDK